MSAASDGHDRGLAGILFVMPRSLLALPVAVVGALAATCSGAGGALSEASPFAQVLGGPYASARAAAAADMGTPDGVQARYDTARDLENALPAVASRDCVALRSALLRYARTQIASAEAFDRLNAKRAANSAHAAEKTRSTIDVAAAACRGTGALAGEAAPPQLLAPRNGEAFTGIVTARAPGGASSVQLTVDGVRQPPTKVPDSGATRLLVAGPQRPIETIEVRFLADDGRVLSRFRSSRLWLLPKTAWRIAPLRSDPSIDARLAALAKGFSGFSGLWVADLARGREGSWNAAARFPAASTVKLGVLAAALQRYGSSSRRAAIMHEIAAIGGWSSNLAANRLLRLIGGRAPVERALRLLGAASSSYPGEYRVGTSRARATTQPPVVSQRVTTARDLGAVLTTLVRIAGGNKALAARADLDQEDARLIFGLLLRSSRAVDNIGLLTPSLPRGLPIAAKNGWISSARHSAAAIFGARRTVIAVVLTYREGLTRTEAQRLGQTVARTAVLHLMTG